MGRKPRKQEKSPMTRYTMTDFRQDFPDDTVCLEWLKNQRWPDGIFCETCGKVTTHYLIESRKSYSCEFCGHHVHPTADTIFHKSSTPLTTWFYVVYLMAQTRGGIAAKQVERETGVTYKTAWRMCNLIRQQLEDGKSIFGGDVEVDESYFGGKSTGGKRGRGAEKKTPVVGMAERKEADNTDKPGRIQAAVVPDVKRKTVFPLIEDAVAQGATVYTDEFNIYDTLSGRGYEHHRIMHSAEVYVVGDVHTNTIEGFWANVKNSILGVYHGVSPQHLQGYLNEFTFRYNHRNDVTPMFQTFLDRVARPAASESGD